jgi:DnaJ-class molecular chaperone
MKNPFSVLKVAETAADEEIRQAYLREVRKYPPELAPERFQEIRTAFETIKTRRDRCQYQLFHSEPPGIETLLAPWLQTATTGRPTEQQLREAIVLSLQSKKPS